MWGSSSSSGGITLDRLNALCTFISHVTGDPRWPSETTAPKLTPASCHRVCVRVRALSPEVFSAREGLPPHLCLREGLPTHLCLRHRSTEPSESTGSPVVLAVQSAFYLP